MATVKNITKSEKKLRPAATPEARESQMVSLAMDLAEQRLRNGTASASEVVHFLKLGTVKEKKETEILELQKELLVAKTDAYKSGKRVEELYANALSAMQLYKGERNDVEPVEEL